MRKVVIELTEYEIESCITSGYALHSIYTQLVDAVRKGKELPKCKDCRFFEYDFVTQADGIPLILGHELCKKWGDGCKTKEDGYCFLFEEKKGEKNGHG